MKSKSNTELTELTFIELNQINGGGLFYNAGAWFASNCVQPVICALSTYFTFTSTQGKATQL